MPFAGRRERSFFFFFYAKSFRRARTGTKSFNAAYVRAKLCNCGVCAGKRIVSSEKRAMLLHPFSGYTPAKSDIFDFRNARPWDPCFVEWSHFISGNQEFVLHPNQATRTRWRMLFGLISHWFLSRWCNVLLCVQRRIKTHRKQMCEKRAGWKKKSRNGAVRLSCLRAFLIHHKGGPKGRRLYGT